MLYAIVTVLILIADQGLKYWVTLNIPLDTGSQTLIPGVLELRNIHNYGAAFSLLRNAPQWLFIIIALLFAAIVIFCLRRNWIHGRFGRWTAVLVLAGALGNCIDRMLSGYVVDMFSFPFWESFAVFNLADVFITVCGILFCLHVLLYRPAKTQTVEIYATLDEDGFADEGYDEDGAPLPPEEPEAAEDDPFAGYDWSDAAPAGEETPEEEVEPLPAPEPEPEPEPEPIVPEPEEAAKTDDDDFNFSLEDILREFSDYE